MSASPSRTRWSTRTHPAAASVAAAMAVIMTAGACGGSGGDGVVELRFSWWGSDSRHAIFQEVIENFEAANPDIRVLGDYTDWNSYWDRLATSTAAGDAPDVIMQEESYLREYGDRGALLDLDGADALDRSELDPLIAESGEVDGRVLGLASGVNTIAVMADPQAFEEAGVDMPDDLTWTWDDFVEVSAQITENTDGKVVGTQGITNENAFQAFARQRGENLYDEDGQPAFSQDTLGDWYRITRELLDSGGQPGPEESVEIDAGGPEQSVLATNQGAMALFWSNQLTTISEAAGRELELLRLPGETEHERTGMYFKPGTYYSLSAGTEHPDEAARFVDYLLNSQEAADLILADLGLPANTVIRENIQDDLPAAGAKASAFMAEIEDGIVDSNPPPPIGAGEVVTINRRIAQELAFGELTPDEAAAQFTAEVEGFLDSGE